MTVSDVDDERGERTASELAESFGKPAVHYVHCDVTREEEFDALWESCEKYFGSPVYGLVNNAGVVPDRVGWRKTIDINLVSLEGISR